MRHSYAISAGTVGVALGEADVNDATSFDTLAQASGLPGANEEGLAKAELIPVDPVGAVVTVVAAAVVVIVAGTDSVVPTVVDPVSVEGGTTPVERIPVPELVELPVGALQWMVCEEPMGYGRYHDGFG